MTDLTQTTPVSLPDPPSLRRRGPARIELTDEAGRSPRITAGLVHVRAGRHLRLKVVPPAAAGVRVVSGPTLTEVVPQYHVPEGGVQVCRTDLRARLPVRRLPVPWPRRATIHISVLPPEAEAFTLNVPVMVWPSVWAVLLVSLVLPGYLVWDRVRELSKTTTLADAAGRIVGDMEFVGQTAAAGMVVAVVTPVLWSLAVWLGLVAAEGE